MAELLSTLADQCDQRDLWNVVEAPALMATLGDDDEDMQTVAPPSGTCGLHESKPARAKR